MRLTTPKISEKIFLQLQSLFTSDIFISSNKMKLHHPEAICYFKSNRFFYLSFSYIFSGYLEKNDRACSKNFA